MEGIGLCAAGAAVLLWCLQIIVSDKYERQRRSTDDWNAY